ncbi:hypothetical protein CL614_01670 [archaeon]|nr:hypothetical protein [archaeon]|tara:strand:- start:1099 stop:1515 length:417 start_codon:yes stop_codon:yes gene_type:complete
MKYITLLPILIAVILLAGCTTQDTTSTVQEASTIETTVETTVETTETTVNESATTTIKLGSACTDTDGGKNYDERGEVKNPQSPVGLTSARDRCVSNVTLNEYYCQDVVGKSYDYEIVSEQYKCPILCFNGVCVEEIS